MTLGSLRHEIRIDAPADIVWERVNDAANLHEWFPGMTACTLDGNQRIVSLASGAVLPEEILVRDSIERRFQYRITAPIFTYHRGTIDVIDLGDGTCEVIYSTDADPRTMALLIASGTRHALVELKRQMESLETSR